MDTFLSKSIKLIKFYAGKCVHFLHALVVPISKDEELQRHEFILNILLLGSIVLTLAADFVVLIRSSSLGPDYAGISPNLLTLIVGIFGGLYLLSRKGYFKISAYIFWAMYFVPVTYTIYVWGADLPQGLLTYALLIILAGILVGSRFAFFTTGLLSVIFTLLSVFQILGSLTPKVYWRSEIPNLGDIPPVVIIFFIILIVSWLYNRELEKSLKRAHESERALKAEKDLLEVRVKERTRELELVQLEKARQLYRFAEFGKMTSGFLHDLVNPLTALSMNLEERSLEKADKNLKRVFKVVDGARHQIQKQEALTTFSVPEEIALAAQMLSSKAKDSGVEIEFYRPEESVKMFGDSLKFYRLITGLLSNAIESYDNLARSENPKVFVGLSQTEENIRIKVEDFGSGIEPANLSKIFEPLFTTKSADKGIGMGLTICKEIAEHDFDGKLLVKSEQGKGSVFTVELPIRTEKYENNANQKHTFEVD